MATIEAKIIFFVCFVIRKMTCVPHAMLFPEKTYKKATERKFISRNPKKEINQAHAMMRKLN